MKLLTKKLEERFAKVGRQEEVKDPIVICKFFNSTGMGYWFATEMCYNITYVKSNPQMPEVRESSSKEKNDSVQDLLKQGNSENKDKGQLISNRAKKPSIQEWNKDGQRVYYDIQSEPSVTVQKLCEGSNSSNGKETGEVSGKERGSTSQESGQVRRQPTELEVDDENPAQVLSYEDGESETLDINASELKNYPNAKINNIEFFGYVSLFGDYNDEWGSFSLAELEEYKGWGGLGIERDLYFKECPASEVIEKYTHS